MRAIIFTLLTAMPAHAACTGKMLLACPVAGDYLEVCLEGDQLTYGYGPKDSPSRVLTEPLANGTYTPWNGIGRSIWENIAFRDKAYVFNVFMSFDRMDENAQTQWGVAVELDGQQLFMRLCDAPDVAVPFDTLYSEMQARGLCWNRAALQWQTGGCP